MTGQAWYIKFNSKFAVFSIKKQKATPGFEPGVKALQASALPLGQVAEKKWSGRRDSNSRQSAWKADTLPTELLPHFVKSL